jgi:hypothetical protein
VVGLGIAYQQIKEEGIVLTIIESESKAWAVAATNGDVRVFGREQAGEWVELLLSEDSEQIDGDGSLLLEALYEQQLGREPAEDGEELDAEEDGEELDAEEDEEPEAEEDEEPEAEEDEEPEAEEDEEPEAEEDEEPEDDETEKKPRRSRSRTKAGKK